MINLILKLKSEWRWIWDNTKQGKGADLSKYKLKEVLDKDITKDFDWFYKDNGDYLPYHPEYLHHWYDKKSIIQNGTTFKLPIKRNPKTFNGIYFPFSGAVLQSKKAYRYAYFEAEIIVPKAHGHWPAFWLTGVNTWPPEIDIVEAYSRNDWYNSFRKFNSNVHYGNKNQIGASSHPIPEGLSGKPVKFAVLWEEDRIEWYYNGHLVRRIKDRKVLDYMNQPMRVVITTSMQPQYSVTDGYTTFSNIKIYQR